MQDPYWVSAKCSAISKRHQKTDSHGWAVASYITERKRNRLVVQCSVNDTGRSSSAGSAVASCVAFRCTECKACQRFAERTCLWSFVPSLFCVDSSYNQNNVARSLEILLLESGIEVSIDHQRFSANHPFFDWFLHCELSSILTQQIDAGQFDIVEIPYSLVFRSHDPSFVRRQHQRLVADKRGLVEPNARTFEFEFPMDDANPLVDVLRMAMSPCERRMRGVRRISRRDEYGVVFSSGTNVIKMLPQRHQDVWTCLFSRMMPRTIWLFKNWNEVMVYMFFHNQSRSANVVWSNHLTPIFIGSFWFVNYEAVTLQSFALRNAHTVVETVTDISLDSESFLVCPWFRLKLSHCAAECDRELPFPTQSTFETTVTFGLLAWKKGSVPWKIPKAMHNVCSCSITTGC